MLLIRINSLLVDIEQHEFYSKKALYVKIIYGAQIRVTTTKYNDAAPVWNESFIFDIDRELDHFIVQLIETGTLMEPKIFKRYTIGVMYKGVQKYDVDILNFSMGNIYNKLNAKLKKISYDFKHSKDLLDDRDARISMLSKNLSKYKAILGIKNKKLNSIYKIINT